MRRGIEDLRFSAEGATAFASVPGAIMGGFAGSIAARADATCHSLDAWRTLWPRRRRLPTAATAASTAGFALVPA